MPTDETAVPRPTRRDFLKGSLAAGLVAAGAVHAPAATDRPRRGGTITLASTGGGSSDTLDANNCVLNTDYARAYQLYESLMEMDLAGVIKPALAEELTPNADATEWTIRVRRGVEFHNGKELTAEDVIFTLRRIVAKKFQASAVLAYMDVKNLVKVDNYTVRAPMHAPYSVLPSALYGEGQVSIVPVGYDPRKPVGTGPFKFKFFSPGVRSVFTRNERYWRAPEPYVDEVVIDDYPDETSQVNALLSGDATCVDQLTFASIKAIRNQGQKVNVSSGGGWVPFTMRVDKAPFNDVRVRQAMRLIVDRPKMRELVYGGYGLLGNDIFGRIDPAYDRAIPQRHQDIAQAKHLLKASGHDGLTVRLVTGPIQTGATELAQVFKQDAVAAGVTVNIDTVSSAAFYGPNYLSWTFAQDWWGTDPYLRQVGYSMIPGAPYDETHWDKSPYARRYNSLYHEALATVNAARQTELVHEMMEIDWKDGGYIIPTFTAVISGYSSRLHGVVSSETGEPLSQYELRRFWLS